MSKSYIEGVSYPTTPDWDTERPFLTGQIYLDIKVTGQRTGSKSSSIDTFKNGDVNRAIGIFTPSVQELLVIDDLLFAMTGIEGMYISMKRGRAKDSGIVFQVDASMDLALQELAKRILPLCENYMVIHSFVESRSHFKHGLVNHAFAATLRTILQDYHAMVAQLEHQFRLGRLSLQGLWFFCQPMMGAIQALTTVVQKASAQNLSGSAILNLLQNQAAAMAGDNAARSLLEKLSQYASAAYLGILERWVYEGVIDDPYGEFFIAEDKTLQKESLTEDCNAKYWQQRYSLKPGIPSFLLNSAETILTTGKYLNVLRECGHSVQVPFSENAKLTNSGSDRRYLECINIAYNFASAELLNLITHKYDLMARLRSMKHYFLLDQGDFLVHFMDTARDELAKKPAAISVEKLQSLLDLALRTSIAATDPFHEDLTCCVERTSLLVQLDTMKKMGNGMSDLNTESESLEGDKSNSDISNQSDSISITGLETFSLDYKVQWPLSLILSKKVLTKYQLIFRLLFHCKHVQRELCGTWQAHQGTRGVKSLGTTISGSYVLCQNMLHFMQSLVHYLTFEVLEPNWHVMCDKLQNTESIDEVMQQHDFFLSKCQKECLLLWPEILQKVEKLKSICLQYAAAIHWLIPSVSVLDSDASKINSSESVVRKEILNKTTNRIRSRHRPLANPVWRSSDEETFKTTLEKFEEEFTEQMKGLIIALSSRSQSEPYLAHLAQGLQGLGNNL
uniref:Gamma-tubulin complex component n=1 Tax=Cupressus duclouxiana TaxID=103966 RepID=A0A3Q8BQ79_9CONI|nr:Spc97 / Spc98 family [Cupressus duclouxiana]